MSLVGQSLLVIARKALVGQTWAEARIMEQPIDPISDVAPGRGAAGKPTIAVYYEKVEGEPCGLETQRGAQDLTLRFVTYLPPSFKVSEDGTEIHFDHKGAGLALNLVARQIEVALHHGNGTWVSLFRKFAHKIEKRHARFLLVELEGGVRIPCVEQTFEMRVLPEPEIARPIYGAWSDLDAALRTDPEETILADLIKAMIEEPTDLAAHEQLQATWNLSDAAFAATGLAPLATGDDGEVVEGVNEIISEPDVTVTPPGFDNA
jgi:hypothetical protein